MEVLQTEEVRIVLQQGLIDRIEELFLTEGFEDFTVGDLAARLGCSRRALYEVAPSKKMLLVNVVERNYQRRLTESVETIYAHGGPLERLFAFFEGIRDRNDRARERYLRDVIANPDTNKVRLRHVMKILDLLENILRDGMSRGIFRKQDPVLVTALGLGMLQTIASPDLAARLKKDYVTLFDEGVDLLLRGVLKD